MENRSLRKGGAFLIEEQMPEESFIPEQVGDEHRMIMDTCRDFLEQYIYPNQHRIENQEDGLARHLLKQMGDMGLLGSHMPEAFGGMQLDNNTNTLISDILGPAGSFTVSYAVQIGIGMLPILYYGTEHQKEKYLPPLISGDLVACYCLTEPGSGSDALAAKTRAELSEDGSHYKISGQKMWISNAGFADIFIVFAKIDGEKFTCFIIEKGAEGLTLGEEEAKMGIKGSSTRQVFFDNVKVPAENVLGEIGRGHSIAFNVLNIGRFKLGALCLGGARKVADLSIKYATERHQFNQPIGQFGAIMHKLAQQAVRIFACESALYRLSNHMEQYKQHRVSEGATYEKATLDAAEQFAIECSILKIEGSEVLDFVVDEAVQIHGGIGFSEEYPIARAYRDSRINRIYEGTNEINRLLMVDMLFKKAMKGELDIVGPAWAVQKELASMPSMQQPEGEFGHEWEAIRNFKKICLMVAGGAAKKQMDGELQMRDEQELLMNIADMLTEIYLSESVLLRIERAKQLNINIQDTELHDSILKVQITESQFKMQRLAIEGIAAFAEGDLLKTFQMGIKRYIKYPTVNTKALRRKIAQSLLEKNAFALGLQ
jgi:alkylation response protein AidB-like acyl-CoA dehydrogenase